MTEEAKYREVTDWGVVAFLTVEIFVIVFSISEALILIISLLTATSSTAGSVLGIILGLAVGTILGYIIAYMEVKRQGRSWFTKKIKVDSNE